MTAEPRCDCCDLPVSSCGKALEQRQRAQTAVERQTLVARGAVEARFYGSCVRCDGWFGTGTLIRYDPQAGGWVAECCA